ncbi:MAG: hypothetical protein JWO37_3106 [Acidimicrobiales bacterium]|nr:hypothetical protein [Acidimicrobiales bacterium]
MASTKRADRRAAARDQQRAERARRATVAQRRTERRRRAGRVARQAVFAAVAFALVSGIAAVVRSATKPAPGTLAVATPLPSYAIDYRVEFTNGHVVNTDHHVVDRPFRSLYTTTRDGKQVTGSIVNEKGLWFLQPPQWQLITPGGAPAGDDPQPTLALRAGIAKHFAKVTGKRTIIGRACTMVRSGGALGETMKKPTARNHTDLCVDGNDLILDYRWTLDGKLVQTMRAVNVDLHPDVSDATFTPSPVNASPSPVTATALTDDIRSKLDPKFTPPPGVTYAEGWVRIEQGGQTPAPRITTSELYRDRNGEVIEVRSGPSDSGPTGFEVRLSNGRLASLDLNIDHSTVTVTVGNQAVRLVGRDPDELVRLAASVVFQASPG